MQDHLLVSNSCLRIVPMSQIVSAIDIGSNAIRMILAELDSGQIRPLKKFRAAVRLGADVFRQGFISEQTLGLAEETFIHLAHLNKKYDVRHCRAVATSATREAQNKQEFVERIEKISNIKLEIIDSSEEAQLIFSAVKHEVPLENKNVLLIDVGGGSVELTHVDNGQLIVTQSFPLGTVRLLEALHKKKMTETHFKIILGDHLNSLDMFIQKNLSSLNLEFAIGTGGNLECMSRLKLDLLKKTPNTYCTLDELNEISEQLFATSTKDRIEKWHLRPDRADVIVPAVLVVKIILRQCSLQKILTPGVGLRDGILWSMLKK
jgi:exopolyphosphatase/guanosine-5'-triphosphate,3'-diphosphate pyrophosphatase